MSDTDRQFVACRKQDLNARASIFSPFAHIWLRPRMQSGQTTAELTNAFHQASWLVSSASNAAQQDN